jgi:predicted Zn finger-like uncharacterized protein
MIIECTNCIKKFDIDKGLIPDEGRLLQCSSCNHEWFFKSEAIPELVVPIKNDNLKIFESENTEYDEPIDADVNININDKININHVEKIKKIIVKDLKNKKKHNILSLTVIFTISFVALIVLIDTFKYPLGKIVPNIEFLLYNFYESFKDMTLFFRDLI